MKINVIFEKVKTKKLSNQKVLTFPKILCIHVNRLVYYDGSYRKMETKINYDPIMEIEGQKFKLKSIISHQGGSGGGHYFAIQKAWIPLIDLNNVNKCVPSGIPFRELNWIFASDES